MASLLSGIAKEVAIKNSKSYNGDSVKKKEENKKENYNINDEVEEEIVEQEYQLEDSVDIYDDSLNTIEQSSMVDDKYVSINKEIPIEDPFDSNYKKDNNIKIVNTIKDSENKKQNSNKETVNISKQNDKELDEIIEEENINYENNNVNTYNYINGSINKPISKTFTNKNINRQLPKYQNRTSGVSSVKNFPKSMLEYIKKDIIPAFNISNSDALQAYIIAKSGMVFSGNSTIAVGYAKEIIKNDDISIIRKQNEKLLKHIEYLNSIIDTNNIIVSTILCQLTGHLDNQISTMNIEDIDFLEDNILELLDRVRAQLIEKDKADKIIEGRPIR